MKNTLYDGDKMLVNKSGKITKSCLVIFNKNNDTYIKRCVSLPGDTVQIVNGNIYVNKTINVFPNTILLPGDNAVSPETPVSSAYPGNSASHFNLATFENYHQYWNNNNFGPLLVPKKDQTILLDTLAAGVYKQLIMIEQNIDVSSWEKFLAANHTYQFQNNYYFMVGDNRSNSGDSRSNLGLIARKDIIGTTSLILYSKKSWSRILKKVK